MKADGFRRAVMSLVGLTLIFSIVPVVGVSAGSPSGQPTLTLTSETYIGTIGTCKPLTVHLVDANGQPVTGRFVDVEQRHDLANNGTVNDEPRVSFCKPSTGTNVGEVETDEGDLVESPDNLGTLGGETEGETDANGMLTFGVSVAPANDPDASGEVTVTAFLDVGGDDPDADEPQDTESIYWNNREGRSIDCEPETTTLDYLVDEQWVECKVVDEHGAALSGVSVTFYTRFVPDSPLDGLRMVTDENGEVGAWASSPHTGEQMVSGILTADLIGHEPDYADECDRDAGDPQGAPAGRCQDDIFLRWAESPVVQLSIWREEVTRRPGEIYKVRVYALNGSGYPVADTPISWKTTGVGTIVKSDSSTRNNAEAWARVRSRVHGVQTITVTAEHCATGGSCEREMVLNWGPRNCTVFGTDGDDLLLGTSGQDVVCGFDGDDDLYSGRGHDVLIGGHGEDKLVAGGGNDSLKGKQGDDELYGQSGGDFLQGGSGVDYLIGGSGVDICRGGPSVEYVFRCN